MTDLVGHQLGQYEVQKLIAKGGMATVYLARQKNMNRDVALKILPSILLHDDNFLERFYREVEVIANLQHPHIMPVYDFGEYDNMPFISMAYLSGGTLADLIKRGPMSPDDIVRITNQMADALDYAHSKNIIHRDFKPSNVLLDARGNTYLADFGLAKVTSMDSQITGTAILGTPTYMAPEQASAVDLTAAADVYALGVTIFQMLTGRVPFDAPTSGGLLVAHLTQPVPDVRMLRPDLPADAYTVMLKAMAKKPEDRYQSAGELATELADALKPATQEMGGVGAGTPGGLVMTNMLGHVIFMDHPCMKMLKRHQREARAIIGKPLHDVLGVEKRITDDILKQVGTAGIIDHLEFEVRDAHGATFPVMCQAVATRDDRGEFVGADINLRDISSALNPHQMHDFETAEKRLDTTEESFLQTYFTAQLRALSDLVVQLGGPRMGRNLEAIINETAERNVWPVRIQNGEVHVELRSNDADIYRALLAKAVVYAVKLIGKKMVSREMQAVEKKMDARILEVVKELRVHDLLQEVL